MMESRAACALSCTVSVIQTQVFAVQLNFEQQVKGMLRAIM